MIMQDWGLGKDILRQQLREFISHRLLPKEQLKDVLREKIKLRSKESRMQKKNGDQRHL